MRAGSATFTPKGYTPLGEAITHIGRSFSDEWTGEEFAPALASMTEINRDTQTYLIGWTRAHCAETQDCDVTWEEATETYMEARSLLDEIAQYESIKAGGGHLAKIWSDPERAVDWEWPEDFPLSSDDLQALKVEDEGFRAPREAAYKRLDEAARLLQQELCGTPPDCEDVISALWRYPDKMPKRIDPTTWIGPAGLNRLKCAARDDHPIPGRSRIIVSSDYIGKLCTRLATPKTAPKKPAGRPTFRPEIEAAYKTLVKEKKVDYEVDKVVLCKPIREKVHESLNGPGPHKGLGNGAILKWIRPLFDADKAAHDAQSKPT